MVEINTTDEPTLEGYLARFEQSNIYFNKCMDFATCGKMPMQTREKAINMALARAKAMKKIG